MASKQDYTDELARTKQAVKDDEAADAALVETLNQKIADLEAGSISPDEAIAALTEIRDSLQSGGTTPTEPPVEG